MIKKKCKHLKRPRERKACLAESGELYGSIKKGIHDKRDEQNDGAENSHHGDKSEPSKRSAEHRCSLTEGG